MQRRVSTAIALTRPDHCVGRPKCCVPSLPTWSVSGPTSRHLEGSFTPARRAASLAALIPLNVWACAIAAAGYARFSYSSCAGPFPFTSASPEMLSPFVPHGTAPLTPASSAKRFWSASLSASADESRALTTAADAATATIATSASAIPNLLFLRIPSPFCRRGFDRRRSECDRARLRQVAGIVAKTFGKRKDFAWRGSPPPEMRFDLSVGRWATSASGAGPSSRFAPPGRLAAERRWSACAQQAGDGAATEQALERGEAAGGDDDPAAAWRRRESRPAAALPSSRPSADQLPPGCTTPFTLSVYGAYASIASVDSS